MTQNENLIAAHLLAMAAEQFSNHGCNDMDWGELKLSEGLKMNLAYAYNRWNNPDGDEDQRVPFVNIGDASWMSFFAARLKAEATNA